jgi:hypothetical protein
MWVQEEKLGKAHTRWEEEKNGEEPERPMSEVQIQRALVEDARGVSSYCPNSILRSVTWGKRKTSQRRRHPYPLPARGFIAAKQRASLRLAQPRTPMWLLAGLDCSRSDISFDIGRYVGVRGYVGVVSESELMSEYVVQRRYSADESGSR